LIGSSGLLEVSVNKGDAARELDISIGEKIEVNR